MGYFYYSISTILFIRPLKIIESLIRIMDFIFNTDIAEIKSHIVSEVSRKKLKNLKTIETCEFLQIKQNC